MLPRDEQVRGLTVAAVMVSVAVGLTHLCWHVVQYTPFIFGFAAVVVTSRVAGRVAGMLAVLIGVVGFIGFPPPLPADQLPRLLAGFAALSGAFGWVVARRYEIESALRASRATITLSERRLQAIFDAEPACVTLTSADGRLIDMNRAGLRMIGANTLAEIAGEPVVSFVHPDDQSRYTEMHRRVVEGTPTRLEFRIVGRTGKERWVDAHAAPFETSDAAEEPGVLSVVSDITDRRQLEVQLHGAQQMEVVGRLAGGIAHDFNNLLTAIAGFTELVLTSLEGDDPRRSDLLEVRHGCDRAAALTRQLLAFSRRQPLQPRVVDINTLVLGVQKLLCRTIREDILLTVALDAVDPVCIDPTQFEQVLLNLTINARDAMPQGGEIRISTESVDVGEESANRRPAMRPGRYVRLTVTDTGVGMSPDTQSHAFEPFFTTKPVGQGTGLGLSTVYGIVKQSGGFVWLTSALGRGTTFDIFLPHADTAAVPSNPLPDSEVDGSAGGNETVLLVEDNEAVRRLAREALLHAGYTVWDACSADEAEALAREHGPAAIDLLVTDVVMPGLNGPALADRLRAQHSSIRVLYISGYAEGITSGAGVERGLQLLSKPFLPGALLRRVRAVLDSTDQGFCRVA